MALSRRWVGLSGVPLGAAACLAALAFSADARADHKHRGDARNGLKLSLSSHRGGWHGGHGHGYGYSHGRSHTSSSLSISIGSSCGPRYATPRTYCPPPVTYCPPPVVVVSDPCDYTPVYRTRRVVVQEPVVVERPVYVERQVVVERPVERVVEKTVYVEKPVERVVTVEAPARQAEPRSEVRTAPQAGTYRDRELGDAYLRMGDWENAVRVYRRYLAAWSGDGTATRNLGFAQIADGDVRDGFRNVVQGYKLEPDMIKRPLRVSDLGGARSFGDLLDAAARGADGANNAEGWLTVAMLQHINGSKDAALAALQKSRDAGLDAETLDAVTLELSE